MAGKFNHRIFVISVLSIFVLAAAAAIVAVGTKPTPPLPIMTLPDGTTVKILALTLGEEHWYSTDPVRDKLRRFLPKPFQGLVRKGILSARMQTPPDSLVIWMTRLGGPTVALFPPVVLAASTPRTEVHYITDSHGCMFQANQSARSMGTGCSLIGMAFPTFPRADPTIEYIISDNLSTRTRFSMPNPFKVTPRRWTPETLPITKTNSDLVVQLRAIQLAAWPQTPFDPRVELIRAPELELWQKGPVRFFDSVGNCLPAARGAFCTSESVWKVEASFFRGPRGHFHPDEIWRVSNVAIPKADGITRLRTTKTLNGFQVGLESVQGAIYSEPGRTNTLGSQPIPSDALNLLFWSRRNDPESKLLVRGHDATGRILLVREPTVFSAVSPPGPQEQHRFEIYPWPDSRTLTLEVIVQKPVRFEFFVGSKDYGRKL